MKRYEKITRNVVLGSSLIIGCSVVGLLGTFMVIVNKVGVF